MSTRGARLVQSAPSEEGQFTFQSLFATSPYPEEREFGFVRHQGDLKEWNDVPDGVEDYEFDKDQNRYVRIRFRSVTWAYARPWWWVQIFCCGTDFKLTRGTWLRWTNAVCAAIHLTMMILCISAGADKNDGEMNVPLWRTMSRWENAGADGYSFRVVESGWAIRIDYLTASFFGLSFAFHAMAALLSGLKSSVFVYWRQLDLGFCYWRCAR